MSSEGVERIDVKRALLEFEAGALSTVLQQKDIVHLAVVSLGPQMTLVARVEQLRGDT